MIRHAGSIHLEESEGRGLTPLGSPEFKWNAVDRMSKSIRLGSCRQPDRFKTHSQFCRCAGKSIDFLRLSCFASDADRAGKCHSRRRNCELHLGSRCACRFRNHRRRSQSLGQTEGLNSDRPHGFRRSSPPLHFDDQFSWLVRDNDNGIGRDGKLKVRLFEPHRQEIPASLSTVTKPITDAQGEVAVFGRGVNN